MNKHIFIIGYNKTATTALHVLFLRSGYSSIHFAAGRLATDMVSNIARGKAALEGYDKQYQVFSDVTYLDYRTVIEGNEYFDRIASDYPESQFIYNFRGMESWLRSRRRHVSRKSSCGFIDRYRSALNLHCDEDVLQAWSARRIRLEERLHSYFKDSARLLILDVERDDVPMSIQAFADVTLNAQHWQRQNVSDNKYLASN